jgi:Flp pilus assembly protein TadD
MSGSSRNSAAIVARSAVLAVATLMGACSSLSEETGLSLLAASQPPADARAANEGGAPQTELGKATEYWGKEYSKNPTNTEAAVAYAKNLKALGNKTEAFNVLAQAAQTNPDSRAVASEYGRLALELEKVSLASQMLAFADDPMRPDWRVISARGAAQAKLGKYKEAVQHLERASLLAPEQASVQNNLALAYAMSGDPSKAETMLRKVVARDGGTPKTKQNLALVLGLQGKYDEATQVGSQVVSADIAKQNTNVVRQMVKLEPKASQPFTAPPAIAAVPAPAPATGWSTDVELAATPAAFKPAEVQNTATGTWGATVVSAAE